MRVGATWDTCDRRQSKGNAVNKRMAPVALSVGLLGIVGGVAAANAFQPDQKPAQVQLVQPAAEVVTPSPTTTSAPTTTAPAPVKVTPKPVKKAVAVESSKTTAPAKVATQQKVNTVSEQPAQPKPSPENPGLPEGAPFTPPAPPIPVAPPIPQG